VEHLSSTPVLSGIRVSRSLVFCVVFVYRFLFFSFVLFLLGIVSSVRLQFTDMDYPFVIRTLKTERHESHLKPGLNSGVPEKLVVPAPHVKPVVLHRLHKVLFVERLLI
jgi:hypothetical protein